ncbi:MAG: HAD family hydrolase [Bacteroidota bacterium]
MPSSGTLSGVLFMPATVRMLVFDIDLTLYDDRAYYESQEYALTKRLAEHLGQPIDEVEAGISAVREEHKAKHGGRLSMANTFKRFGVPIEENARWRAELFKPEDYLSADPRLDATLAELQGTYRLAAVTNNATSIGHRTLEILGVHPRFDRVLGIDDALESKPTIRPFRILANEFGIPITEMVSIGDRRAVDLDLPMAHGAGGILVRSVEDVYALPAVLRSSG